MEPGEIVGGSIATFIIVLTGLVVLPLAERLTGQTMLLVTLPVAAAGCIIFIMALRNLEKGKGRESLHQRIQATRAGIIFISAIFWSVLLVLPTGSTVLDLYDSLPLDAKFFFWFGLNGLIAVRVYTSLLTRTPAPEGEEPEISFSEVIIPKKR